MHIYLWSVLILMCVVCAAQNQHEQQQNNTLIHIHTILRHHLGARPSETMHNSMKTALFEKSAHQQCADPPSKISVFSLFGSDFCALTNIR